MRTERWTCDSCGAESPAGPSPGCLPVGWGSLFVAQPPKPPPQTATEINAKSNDLCPECVAKIAEVMSLPVRHV